MMNAEAIISSMKPIIKKIQTHKRFRRTLFKLLGRKHNLKEKEKKRKNKKREKKKERKKKKNSEGK